MQTARKRNKGKNGCEEAAKKRGETAIEKGSRIGNLEQKIGLKRGIKEPPR